MTGDKSCLILACCTKQVRDVWSDGGRISEEQVAEEQHMLFRDIQRRELLSFLRWVVPKTEQCGISQLVQKIMLTMSEDGAQLKALPWCPNGTFRISVSISVSVSIFPVVCVSVAISSSVVCACVQDGISFSSLCCSSSL